MFVFWGLRYDQLKNTNFCFGNFPLGFVVGNYEEKGHIYLKVWKENKLLEKMKRNMFIG